MGTLKNAADQCSGKRPGVVWLHFLGLPDQDFLALCEFSTSGSGTGLNGAVADALHPNLSDLALIDTAPHAESAALAAAKAADARPIDAIFSQFALAATAISLLVARSSTRISY